MSHRSKPTVSLVLVAYNMARELPRTLLSLSPRMQRDVAGLAYEIVVVDNGSDPPVASPPDGSFKLLRMTDAAPSPVAAVNRGLAESQGELVGVLIDGARMASPGIVATAARAARLHPRPVIATLGFHLGPAVQMSSIHQGYDQRAEDALLEKVRWTEDGYRLFEISVFAGSSARGWFSPIAESNALFMPRAMWDELEGYDERFREPGGGLVNLDTYARACALPGSMVIVLLGEATFHQFHGGVATNSPTPPIGAFHDEYRRIRGGQYRVPPIEPLYLGSVHPAVLPSIRAAADMAASEPAEARPSEQRA